MTSFTLFFSAQTWDKVTASIVSLSWLITVYQGLILFTVSMVPAVLDRGTFLFTFDLCFCKVCLCCYSEINKLN